MGKHIFFHFLSKRNTGGMIQMYEYQGCILEKEATLLQYCILSLRSKYMP